MVNDSISQFYELEKMGTSTVHGEFSYDNFEIDPDENEGGIAKNRPRRSESEEKNRLLESYFHDLVKYSLLSPEKEKRYSAIMDFCRKRLQQFDKNSNSEIDQGNATNVNSPEQSGDNRTWFLTQLFRKKLNEIRYEFVNANLRFVINVSKQFTGRGLPFADLIQEGNMGLMKAVDKFDHKKGFRFTTYASWWIRQSIARAVMKKTNTVAIPVYLQEQKNKVLRSKYKLKDELNKIPSVEEIASDTSLSEYAVDKIVKGFGMHSLDNFVSGEDYKTYKDVLPDDKSPGQEDLISNSNLKDLLSVSLGSLDDKEEDILRLRYGVGIDSIVTLQQIAEKYNLSQERIRQIEKDALKKIANSETGKKLLSLV